jgi:hypothetical protein
MAHELVQLVRESRRIFNKIDYHSPQTPDVIQGIHNLKSRFFKVEQDMDAFIREKNRYMSKQLLDETMRTFVLYPDDALLPPPVFGRK